jgi:hypothetical protein
VVKAKEDSRQCAQMNETEDERDQGKREKVISL